MIYRRQAADDIHAFGVIVMAQGEGILAAGEILVVSYRGPSRTPVPTKGTYEAPRTQMRPGGCLSVKAALLVSRRSA